MTVTAMREALITRYSPVIRGQRVDRMPDAQVMAIYRSLINRKDPIVKCGPGIPKRCRLHEREKFEQLEMDLNLDGERFRNDQTA